MGVKLSALAERHCKACEGGTKPLGEVEIAPLLAELSGWSLAGQNLTKRYEFKNYYATIAFVNAVAWIAHTEDHHPDMEVTYRHCRVSYTTHSIGGLSENDFISAAKVDALLAGSSNSI